MTDPLGSGLCSSTCESQPQQFTSVNLRQVTEPTLDSGLSAWRDLSCGIVIKITALSGEDHKGGVFRVLCVPAAKCQDIGCPVLDNQLRTKAEFSVCPILSC